MDTAPRTSTHLDDELDAVLIGGREPGTVEIVAYDPGWRARFEDERRSIAAALGPLARRIEHIGSTSVPGSGGEADRRRARRGRRPRPRRGLCRAPEVRRATSFASGSRATGCSGRPRATCTCTSGRPVAARAPTTSCCATGSAPTPSDRRLYESAKRAARRLEQWRDMNYYAEAKSPVIAEIMARARGDRSP